MINHKALKSSLVLIILFIYNLPVAESRNFQFAWLSDTHVCARTGKKDLKLTVQDINHLDNVDFVIVSGDLTEYDINSCLDTTKKILDKLDIPYYVIPGNHDTKWSSSGCTKFTQLWGDEEFAFNFQGLKFIGFDQGPIIRMGFGYVAPEDIRWLKTQLSDPDAPDRPIIIITHYPLDSSVGNYEEVVNILKSGNIQAILHGHGHSNRIDNYSNIPGVMGRSTLRDKNQNSGYNLVKVTGDSIIFSEHITGGETLFPWHRLPIEKHKYDVKSINIADTIDHKDSQVKIKWQYDTKYSITNSAAVAKGKVFVGNSSGNLYAFSIDTGKLLWTCKTGNNIYSTPALSQNFVVFSSTDSTIYCLSINNGDLLWTIKTQAPNIASPLIRDDVVYVGGSDKVFRAIELHSGKILWQYDKIEGYVETKPTIYQDNVIFGAWDNCLYALNRKTGKLAWKWQDGTKGTLYSPAACRPVAAYGRVYIVAPDRVMSCIHAENGQTIWRSDRDKVRESLGISEDSEMIFARCMWDTLFAINASLPDFQYKWKRSLDYGYDIDPSYPVEKDGTLYFSTGTGIVYAIAKDTGKLKWKFKISNGLVNTVTPISKNEVIVTSVDGKISYLSFSE